ncbi:hypothetical protein PZB74_00925 [Porifericola rhodea]|uniref:hypothetical protein n=1 Tax=Porifericola rhodea TaxID=930972 RepID=UPI002666C36A|nr:hypothetical protein [Porifericola rhodea]WKN31920.1 hypothetical protein PZB74_00925 [Porifericola rhodea]
MEDTETLTDRVADNTKEEDNLRILRDTNDTIKFYAKHPEFIDRRLRMLNKEWDIERTLETNASTLSLLGIALSVLVNRRFIILPALVAAFLLQHGLQGWCPPLIFFRKKGIRTKDEINREKNILKAIRGDYDTLCEAKDAEPKDRLSGALRAFKA